jgi:hypothetical protein
MAGANKVIKGGAATLGDLARLWGYLQTDFIPGLRIELEPIFDKSGQPLIRVVICDYSTVTEPKELGRSVWAVKEYRSEIYLISHTQLFDLLISAHKVIDEFFRTGIDNRPLPSKG